VLKRIELTNFMSHVETVIEPAAGLTVLVGPNNCGKSAVVAALQILCHNLDSTYVLRHGAKECKVAVQTADGHTIEWRRKKSPSYVIDGAAFDRLGKGGVPESLPAALRLGKVDAGDDVDFDIHFGAQKSPIFLLDKSGATAAKFFAASSDALRLVQMQRRHKEKLNERQRERSRLEAESKQLVAELEALQPAADLDQRVKRSESVHGELLRLADWLVRAEYDAAAIAAQATEVVYRREQATALVALAPPPPLAPTAPLAEGIARIENASLAKAHAAARDESLAPLAAPPQLVDTRPWETIVAQLASLEQTIARDQARIAATHHLAEPPRLEPTEDLERRIDQLAGAEREAKAQADRAAALETLATPPLIGDEGSLLLCIEGLGRAERLVEQAAAAADVLSRLAAGPQPRETEPLADLLKKIEATSRESAAAESDLAHATRQLLALVDEAQALAASAVCPTCGAALDPNRLLQSCGGLHNESPPQK
jgi:exonuclease SbcC